MRYILSILTIFLAGSGFDNISIRIPANINQYVVETTTDSTKPIAQMSSKEKMDGHVIHFTGAVMSDTFVVSHFSRAFVNDEYSDFLKPGKYNDGSKVLPKSIASSLDGIAIPKKTRLIVYNKLNLTGQVLLDVTGPLIVNSDIWETSDFYNVANKKNFRGELQEIFPQKLRRYSGKGSNSMASWYTFSFEIQSLP